jgi:hypothetical protein
LRASIAKAVGALFFYLAALPLAHALGSAAFFFLFKTKINWRKLIKKSAIENWR